MGQTSRSGLAQKPSMMKSVPSVYQQGGHRWPWQEQFQKNGSRQIRAGGEKKSNNSFKASGCQKEQRQEEEIARGDVGSREDF